jgi:hypothetical protein
VGLRRISAGGVGVDGKQERGRRRLGWWTGGNGRLGFPSAGNSIYTVINWDCGLDRKKGGGFCAKVHSTNLQHAVDGQRYGAGAIRSVPAIVCCCFCQAT